MAIDGGSEPRLVLHLGMLINPFTAPKPGFVGFRPPAQLYLTHSTLTHSLLSPLSCVRNALHAPRPSRLRQKPSTPAPSSTHTTPRPPPHPLPTLQPHTTSSFHHSRSPCRSAGTSVFLFCSTILRVLSNCAYPVASCARFRTLINFMSTTDRNRDLPPHSANRRSTSRGDSSVRGRRSPVPLGEHPGTLSSLRVSF